MYHSHTDEVADTYAGLMGPIEITRGGMARDDGSPKDVDREIFALFSVLDENASPFLLANLHRFTKPPYPDDPGGDEEFAKDLAQAVLVSHLDMISAVLDFLGVPHENGFFAKDMDAGRYFTEGWEARTYEEFHTAYPEPLLLFYINHLRWELLSSTDVYRPASPSAA
jgi:hypothetical protein